MTPHNYWNIEEKNLDEIQRQNGTNALVLSLNTHKSSAGVTECGPFVRGLVKVVKVVEVEAELSTH